MIRQYVIAVCAGLATCSSFGQELPEVGENPTYSDCARISRERVAQEMPLYQQDGLCMRSNLPQFGKCGGCNAGGTAWTQCCSFGDQICNLDHAYGAAMEICLERANARADRERKQQAIADANGRAGQAA